MSLYDYQVSKYITDQDYPFYALLLALYRQADTANQAKITRMWPDQVAEFHARYDAPGAVLPGEPGYDVITRARMGALPDDPPGTDAK